MSIRQENVIPFIVDKKDIPIEAELAFIVGVVGDKIKKGSFFKRSKEQLTQVSKFYWRLHLDTINQRVILVDSLGLYGGGTNVQDLSLSNVSAQIKAIIDASTLKAYTENLYKANQSLIINSQSYPLFDHSFTRSTFDLMKNCISQDMIDVPLILPTFENTISTELIQLMNEIPHFTELKDNLQEIARHWLAEINNNINEIEQTFVGKLQKLQDDVNQRIQRYKEKMDHTIDSSLEKANKAINRALAEFESSTLGLTGLINPIQEHARKIINDIPSAETPKFQDSMKSFLEKSKGQIEIINGKAKELENDRKNLAKALNDITGTFLDTKQSVMDDFESNKAKAQKEVDDMRMSRDKSLAELTEMRSNIKQITDDLCKKMNIVSTNRKEVINKSAVSIGTSVPADIIISLFLIKFQEKNETRYFVIPPLIKPRNQSKVDYPNAERDSAIIGGKRAADKLAEELVFNRRLKSSFDALKATNYIATGEFTVAARQGVDFLLQNNLISKRAHKKIIEHLTELEI